MVVDPQPHFGYRLPRLTCGELLALCVKLYDIALRYLPAEAPQNIRTGRISADCTWMPRRIRARLRCAVDTDWLSVVIVARFIRSPRRRGRAASAALSPRAMNGILIAVSVSMTCGGSYLAPPI